MLLLALGRKLDCFCSTGKVGGTWKVHCFCQVHGFFLQIFYSLHWVKITSAWVSTCIEVYPQCSVELDDKTFTWCPPLVIFSSGLGEIFFSGVSFCGCWFVWNQCLCLSVSHGFLVAHSPLTFGRQRLKKRWPRWWDRYACCQQDSCCLRECMCMWCQANLHSEGTWENRSIKLEAGLRTLPARCQHGQGEYKWGNAVALVIVWTYAFCGHSCYR